MKQIFRRFIIATTVLALFSGCSLPLMSVPLKPQMEHPGELLDLKNIPQDLRPFAKSLTTPMGEEAQKQALRRFNEQQFAPWLTPKTRFNLAQTVNGMKAVSRKTWYAENRQKITAERINELITLASMESIPSLNQPGIAIAPTFMRGLPTAKPFYEAADDFPFDQLQYSEIKQNEPLRILHRTADDAWLMVEAPLGYGWLPAVDVRSVDDNIQKRMTDAQQVVIVKDFAILSSESGVPLPQPKIGVLYPLVREEAEFWLVETAVSGQGNSAALTTARIAKQDARLHPLPFITETVTLIGSELLKEPYGWGELFRNRDCSATTRDFFIPFGIWLPRNSMQQITSGPMLALAQLSNTEKLQLIREKGVPFQTLIHRKGHIMLYVGLWENMPVVLHNAWALRYTGKDQKEKKFYIGRAVLTTLEAGKELPLSRGTLLDHLYGMLILPD